MNGYRLVEFLLAVIAGAAVASASGSGLHFSAQMLSVIIGFSAVSFAVIDRRPGR